MKKKLLPLVLILIIFIAAVMPRILVDVNGRKYLAEKYGDSTYYISSVNYDFKTGGFYLIIDAPESPDSGFTLYAGMSGKIGYDTYESAVEGRGNTAGRINDEYRSAVDEVFADSAISFSHDIAFGDIEFKESDAQVGDEIPDYAVEMKSLTLDGEYDIAEFGKKAGHLTVYACDEDVSAERLAELLLEIKGAMDEKGVTFKAIDAVLEHQPDEEGNVSEDRVEVMSFLYDEIYEKDLAGRVKESDRNAKAYYESQDEMKEEEVQ
ncbi:MAG: hypothetical protein IKV21_03455 [Clostridia bacterium]|nr:hypothetical protein [Clostridia bacterium]